MKLKTVMRVTGMRSYLISQYSPFVTPKICMQMLTASANLLGPMKISFQKLYPQITIRRFEAGLGVFPTVVYSQ